MINAQDSKDILLIAPKANTSSVTTTANFSVQDCDYVTLRMPLGLEKNSSAIGPSITVKEGDTTSSFATWSTSCTLTGANGDCETAHNVVFHIDTKARKKYLEVTMATGTATNDDVVWAAIATLTRQAKAPGSTSDMVYTTNDVVRIL